MGMNVSITSTRQDDPNRVKRIWNAQTNQWEEYTESTVVKRSSSNVQGSKPPMPTRQRSEVVVRQQGGAIPISSQFELVKSDQQSQHQENGESIYMVTDSGAKSKRIWNPHIMKFEFQTIDGNVIQPPSGQQQQQIHHESSAMQQQQQFAQKPPHPPHTKIKPTAPLVIQQKPAMQTQSQQMQVQNQQMQNQQMQMQSQQQSVVQEETIQAQSMTPPSQQQMQSQQQSVVQEETIQAQSMTPPSQQQSTASTPPVKKRVWNSEKKKFEIITVGGDEDTKKDDLAEAMAETVTQQTEVKQTSQESSQTVVKNR